MRRAEVRMQWPELEKVLKEHGVSIIAPIRDAAKVADFANAVEVVSRGGAAFVGFPSLEGGRIDVSFHDGKSADVRIR